MSRCWTCGTYTPDLAYSCATCVQAATLQEVRDAVHAASVDSVERLDVIADLHRRTHEVLLSGFDRLSQALEWGFSSLWWTIEQQTEVLRSIDQTLKTPSETQANEFRIIGERLRQRGETGPALSFLLKALDHNPLDYRIYLGLAHTYLELSRFDEADRALVASLPHAPRTGFDYRSVTYRLRGRVSFCRELYQDAAGQLHQAIALEPRYAKALYDLAQYSACVDAEDECLASLRSAIALDPNYWYAARAEPLLDTFRPQVDAALVSVLAVTLGRVKEELQESVRLIAITRDKAKECEIVAGKLRRSPQSTRALHTASRALAAAKAPFDQDDYKSALAGVSAAAAARASASNAWRDINGECEILLAAWTAQQLADQAAEQARQAEREATRRFLLRTALGIALYLLLAGAVGFYNDRTFGGFIFGVQMGVWIPVGIVILIVLISSS